MSNYKDFLTSYNARLENVFVINAFENGVFLFIHL